MMAAVVHAGSLGRWFEQLCRIQVQELRSVVTESGLRLRSGALIDCGGVYAFWWTGPVDLLHSRKCNRKLELPGPGGRPVLIEIDDEWLGTDTELPIPLYIGKNSSNIGRRVGQHLLLKALRALPLRAGPQKQRHPTTSCQLRAGVEHLFPKEKDTRSLILDNVGLSYVELDGDGNAANRFYLEDLAIGSMRPPLNVDIER